MRVSEMSYFTSSREDVEFEVEATPVYYKYNSEQYNEIPSRKAIVHKDTGEYISIVSKRYRIMQPKTFSEHIHSTFDPKVYDFKYYVSPDYSRQDIVVLIRNNKINVHGDEWKFGAMFTNTLDGTTSLRSKLILIRKVCSNGLTATRWITSESIYHSNRKINEFFEDTVKRFEFNVNTIANHLASLQSKFIEEDALRLVVTKKEWEYVKSILESTDPESRILFRKGKKISMYDAINVITYLTTHYTPFVIKADLRTVENRQTRAINTMFKILKGDIDVKAELAKLEQKQ